MKKIFSCLAIIMILTIGSAVAAPAGGTIGVVDMDKIYAESPQVKVLQEQLSQKGQELHKQLAAEKQKLSPEEFQKKEEEAFRTYLEIKLNFEAQIDTSIRRAAEQVAKEKKLSLIVDKDSVSYGGMDITQDVMHKMQ